jgi:hypothetical protein
MPAPRRYVTEAIVLSRFDYGEADRILTLITPAGGKIKAIAKGIRKPTSRIGGSVEPCAELRLALWQRCLAPPLPLGDDLDLPFCAEAFELTGGNIRSAGITAAYLAAAAEQPVGMAQLIAAVEQEYRKLGRLSFTGEYVPVGNPSCVTFVDLGKGG